MEDKMRESGRREDVEKHGRGKGRKSRGWKREKGRNEMGGRFAWLSWPWRKKRTISREWWLWWWDSSWGGGRGSEAKAVGKLYFSPFIPSVALTISHYLSPSLLDTPARW